MLLVLAAICIAGAAFIAGEVVSVGARERSLALRRAAHYSRARVSTGPERLKFRERVLEPLVERLARLTLKLNPRISIENVRLKLLRAGLSRRLTPTTFLAAKTGSAFAFAFFGFVLGSMVAAGLGVLFALSWGAGGFALPGLVVTMKTRSRREAMRAQLPDALDLLAVSVEAGLGFDGALDKIAVHTEGALADEFELTLGEMRIGESRHDALKKLAERSDTPEVATFTRAIIQADQLGISLGRILKVQAIDARNRRQMAAEEKAMKLPIKMLFPTVMFIFPAMFLVILAPAVLNLKELF